MLAASRVSISRSVYASLGASKGNRCAVIARKLSDKAADKPKFVVMRQSEFAGKNKAQNNVSNSANPDYEPPAIEVTPRIRRGNLVVAVLLAGFVSSVYYYSIYMMQNRDELDMVIEEESLKRN